MKFILGMMSLTLVGQMSFAGTYDQDHQINIPNPTTVDQTAPRDKSNQDFHVLFPRHPLMLSFEKEHSENEKIMAHLNKDSIYNLEIKRKASTPLEYVKNMNALSTPDHIHNSRYGALDRAFKALSKNQKIDHKNLYRFFGVLSQVALQEHDLASTVFTKSGIIKAYIGYSGSNAAMENYLGIMKTYGDLVSDGKVPTDMTTMQLAAHNYIEQLKLNKLRGHYLSKEKLQRYDKEASYEAAELIRLGYLGSDQEVATAQNVRSSAP